MDHDIEPQPEDSMDAFPAEKYFDHYGYLNYIDSPYKDPELVQRAEQVLDTTTANTVRAKLIHKRKKTLKNNPYLEAHTHDSPLNTPEPDRSVRSGTEPSRNIGSGTIEQSPLDLAQKQVGQQPYTEEEEAWLRLFHAKLRIAIENGCAIKLAGPFPITEAMNNFFASKNANSGDARLAPRTVQSVRGKLGRTWLLKRGENSGPFSETGGVL